MKICPACQRQLTDNAERCKCGHWFKVVQELKRPSRPAPSATALDRAKRFFWGLVSAALAGGIAFGVTLLFKESSALAAHGRATIGTVIDERTAHVGSRRRGTNVDRHTILYAGHTSTFDLDSRLAIGTRVPIVYLPEDPDVARISNDPVSFWSDIKDISVIFFIFLTGLFILFIYGAITNFVLGYKGVPFEENE